ncbi:MAG: hypothetical protein V7717_00225 [Porticoccaceae bacterium]
MNNGASTATRSLESHTRLVLLPVHKTTVAKDVSWPSRPESDDGYGFKLVVLGFSANPTNGVVGISPQQLEDENVCDRVIELDRSLNLPRKLLAEALQISRTTLYDLLNGANREYRNEARLNKMEYAASIIRKSTDYPIGRSAIAVKIDGSSLSDVLKADDISSSAVEQFAVAINAIKERERLAEEDISSKNEQYAQTQFTG